MLEKARLFCENSKMSEYLQVMVKQQKPSKPDCVTVALEKTRVLCKENNMSEHHVMVKQQTHSEFPPKSMQQPSKSDAVTTALISIFETRVIDVLPALGFLFLTYNVVDALFKAGGDYKTISFVVFSYANLIALFYCLKSFEKLPEEGESQKKTRSKVVIWTLATLVNLSLSTVILDPVGMSSFVWTLSCASMAGAFYGLLVLAGVRKQVNLLAFIKFDKSCESGKKQKTWIIVYISIMLIGFHFISLFTIPHDVM